jgi:hypothetical protein
MIKFLFIIGLAAGFVIYSVVASITHSAIIGFIAWSVFSVVCGILFGILKK